MSAERWLARRTDKELDEFADYVARDRRVPDAAKTRTKELVAQERTRRANK